jgi:hypothetical protein
MTALRQSFQVSELRSRIQSEKVWQAPPAELCHPICGRSTGQSPMRLEFLMFAAIKSYALLLVYGLASPFGINLGTEQPKYRVVETLGGGVEVREYVRRIAAEVTVDTHTANEARSEGFNILAGYIFGKNKRNQSMAMTSPVEINSKGRSIAMTSPVEVNARGGSMTMRFFMPASYSMTELPEPTDPRVKLVEVSPVTVAVLRYSGSTMDANTKAKTAQLLAVLQLSKWKPASTSKAFFYNPPWTIPFLRRNEVLVEVAG